MSPNPQDLSVQLRITETASQLKRLSQLLCLLRVGLVGCGYEGKCLAAAIARTPTVRLVACAHHRATVLGRVDDHPGRAMEYYALRGETPLVWAGPGASFLGPAGAVAAEVDEAVFGPGGARALAPAPGWSRRAGPALALDQPPGADLWRPTRR